MAKLDLSDPAAYTRSVEWVRDNVVLKNATSSDTVIQLDITLPGGAQLTVFMDPRNHYLMAFRGKDKVYLLDDPGAPDFKQRLIKFLGSDKDVQQLEGLKTSHEALGTFKRGEKGIRAKVFTVADLRSLSTLSEYSRREKQMTFETLKTPLSLLVCMISESARIPIMQRDFTNMYFGSSVMADEAVRSFDDAKYLTRLSYAVFPEYPVRLGVEKLQKRAIELDDLISKIQSVAGDGNRQRIIQKILDGEMPSTGASTVNDQIKRLRDMAKELKMRSSKELTQLISTCKSESAVRAAKQGVVIPPL